MMMRLELAFSRHLGVNDNRSNLWDRSDSVLYNVGKFWLDEGFEDEPIPQEIPARSSYFAQRAYPLMHQFGNLDEAQVPNFTTELCGSADVYAGTLLYVSLIASRVKDILVSESVGILCLAWAGLSAPFDQTGLLDFAKKYELMREPLGLKERDYFNRMCCEVDEKYWKDRGTAKSSERIYVDPMNDPGGMP